MPFITEEIWHAIYDGKPPLKSIALAEYPQADEKQIDLAAETRMAILQDLIVSVRNLRAELKVEPKVKVPIEVFAHEPEIRAMIEENRARFCLIVRRMWRRSRLWKARSGNCPGRAARRGSMCMSVYEKKIDVAAECERLKKELEKIEKQLASGKPDLARTFLSKAPAHVVEGLRKQVGESTMMRRPSRS